MAIIKFGGGITDARGSLAGNTFSRSRAGSVVRQRVAPIQPNTPIQSARRALLASAVAVFTAMTAAEVSAWQAFADQLTKTNKLGDAYTPSAIQTFVSYYVDQATAGLALTNIREVPASPYQPEIVKVDNVVLTQTALVLDAFEFEITEANTTPTVALIKATPPIAPALQNPSKLYRLLATDSTFTVGGSMDALAYYIAKFGDVADTGDVIDFQLKLVIPGGMSSAWYRVRETVVAAV